MIKDWKKFNEADETANVAQDNAAQLELDRKTYAAANLIKTQAESLKGKTKVADIETAMATLAKQYEKNTESLITKALTYYKVLAEKAKANIKIKEWDNQINTKMLPELQKEIQDLSTKIAEANKTA